MKRLSTFLAALLISSLCLMAQRTYVDDGGINSSLNSTIDLKRKSLHLDFGIGNAIEAGLHAQLNFNKYISWDILCLRYSKQVVNAKSNESCALTGLRGYTPSFGRNQNKKVYLAIDFGYGGYEYRYSTYRSSFKTWNSTFAACAEIGIYLSSHFCLGFSATHMVKDIEYTPAVLRLGYEF